MLSQVRLTFSGLGLKFCSWAGGVGYGQGYRWPTASVREATRVHRGASSQVTASAGGFI